MKLEIFNSSRSPSEAINQANKRIEEMESAGWEVVNILQSESNVYDQVQEKEYYIFNLTVCFNKKKVQ